MFSIISRSASAGGVFGSMHLRACASAAAEPSRTSDAILFLWVRVQAWLELKRVGLQTHRGLGVITADAGVTATSRPFATQRNAMSLSVMMPDSRPPFVRSAASPRCSASFAAGIPFRNALCCRCVRCLCFAYRQFLRRLGFPTWSRPSLALIAP